MVIDSMSSRCMHQHRSGFWNKSCDVKSLRSRRTSFNCALLQNGFLESRSSPIPVNYFHPQTQIYNASYMNHILKMICGNYFSLIQGFVSLLWNTEKAKSLPNLWFHFKVWFPQNVSARIIVVIKSTASNAPKIIFISSFLLATDPPCHVFFGFWRGSQLKTFGNKSFRRSRKGSMHSTKEPQNKQT